MKKRKTMNARDRQRAQAAAAMPTVKRLVKVYGRVAIANCLGKLKARDQLAARLLSLRKEARALARGLR